MTSTQRNKLVDNVIALKLLARLTTPFTEYPAYKTGVIDDKGRYLVKQNKRTREQNNSITYLDKLMINIKKMINKLPGGENKLKNIVAAMVLIKEAIEHNKDCNSVTNEMLVEAINNVNYKNKSYREMLDAYIKYTKQENEDVVTTSAIATTQLPLSPTIVRRKDEITKLHF